MQFLYGASVPLLKLRVAGQEVCHTGANITADRVSNSGQDIYLYPLHALWGVWEDHHRRWSHRVFPGTLPWHHTTNRSVSGFLTHPPLPLSLSLSIHRLSSPSLPFLPLCLYLFIQPAKPSSKTLSFPIIPPTRGHPQPRSVMCEIADVYFVHWGFNLRWSTCWRRRDSRRMSCGNASVTRFLTGLTLFGELRHKQLNPSVWQFDFTGADRAWLS